MKINDITISPDDVNDILQEANPGTAASFSGDACVAYKHARPIALTGVAILAFVYPPAGSAISALVAILDKACEKEL